MTIDQMFWIFMIIIAPIWLIPWGYLIYKSSLGVIYIVASILEWIFARFEGLDEDEDEDKDGWSSGWFYG